MANAKAQRTTIFGDDKPPLLCLSKSTPTIDNSFNRLERNNAPFLNNYLTPLYKQTLEGKSIYDKKGRRYTLLNNILYQDDTPVIYDVEDKHFEQTELNIPNNLLDFDISNDYTIDNNLYARLEWETLENKVTLKFNNRTVTSDKLYNDGVIIACRVRIINDEAYGIVVYKDDTDSLKYLIISDSLLQVRPLNFRTWQARTAASGTFANSSYNPVTLNPLIQIASLGGLVGFTIFSNYGSVMRPNEIGIYTAFIINNDIYELGNNLIPDNTNITQEIVTEHNSYAYTVVAAYTPTETRYAVSPDNGATFYKYDNDAIGELMSVPISFSPTYLGTIEIEGTVYNRYSYNWYSNTLQVNVTMSNPDGLSWKIILDGEESESTTNEGLIVSKVEEGFEPVILTYNTLQINWNGTVEDLINERNVYLTTETTTTGPVGWLVYPNAVMDNGLMYAIWTFANNTNTYANGSYFIHSGSLRNVTASGTDYIYTLLTRETTNANGWKMRSNSFTLLPNFISQSVRITNTSTPFDKQPESNYTAEFTNSNTADLLWKFGSVNNNLLTNYAGGNAADSYPIFAPGGYRASLNEHWNILPYITFDGKANNMAISYSKDSDSMGTIVSSWTDIMQNQYIKYNDSTIIYKDSLERLVRVDIKDKAIVSNIPGDRFILINTTSYYNLWDSELNRKFHYASDYNNRLKFGVTGNAVTEFANNAITRRLVGTGINESYQQINGKYKIASALFPALVLDKIDVEHFRAYGCTIPESRDALGIDVYYTNANNNYTYLSSGEPDTSSAYFDYQFTYYPFNIPHTGIRNEILDTTWSSTGYLYNPNILSKYIVGAANNDYIVNNRIAYPLVYYGNSSDPIMLYNLTGHLENVDVFFVLQGQFYGIMDDKLYSLVYIDGSISERDAIIDIRGMHYLGNTPSIAFFWSSTQRAFYSFTGDANLQPLFPGSKFDTVDYTGHYYEESSQSIWIPTNRGILVFSPKETYLLEDILDVKNIQFDEESTVHVERDEDTINYKYYPEEGFDSNHVILETSFFGVGAGQVSTIDRWDITLYNPYKVDLNGTLSLGVKSITDSMTTFETAPKEITKDKWDKESNSIRISYSPKLIKGQGIRLLVDSPWPITSIVPHTADQGYNQTTNKAFEI
jgi:hypothetical protein